MQTNPGTIRLAAALAIGALCAVGCDDAGDTEAAPPGVSHMGARPSALSTRTAAQTALALAAEGSEPATTSNASPRKPRNLDEALAAASTGTLFLQPRGSDLLKPGPTVATRVVISVTGLLARVRIEQEFRNPGDQWAEGLYVFPLPDDAAVDELRLRTGDRVLEGEVRSKEVARELYSTARREGRRASLVEQQRPNVFTTYVANIEPGGTITIEIEYQQAVRLVDGQMSLRFPMAVRPRHDGGATNATSTMDTALLTAPTIARHEDAFGAASGMPNPITIDVDLMPGFELEGIDSPYHDLQIVEGVSGEGYHVALADGEVPRDRDFVLRWWPMPGNDPKVALFTQPFGDAHYALLLLTPPHAPANLPRIPRELVYVIDTSGSMAGDSIVQARQALALAIDQLAPDDRFNVIAFASNARGMFPNAREASPAKRAQAMAWIGALEAGGGTNILPALDQALRGDAPSGFLRQVVFLTDGSVSNEETILAHVEQNLGASRIFTIGIGSAPNSYLMRKIAELGRGTFTHIGKPEEVADCMAALFQKLEGVVLTDLELVLPRGESADLYPNPIPDLHTGEPVVVVLETEEALDWVGVRGWFGDAPWEAIAGFREGEQRPGVHVLWARRRIDSLMHADLGASGQATQNARREGVLEVALAHHLVSAFTSLVVVDRTPVRRDHETLTPQRVANALPAGWQGRAFGMGATATWAQMHGVVGLACGLLAVATMWVRKRVDGTRGRAR